MVNKLLKITNLVDKVWRKIAVRTKNVKITIDRENKKTKKTQFAARQFFCNSV
jgi:hypothetical protein